MTIHHDTEDRSAVLGTESDRDASTRLQIEHEEIFEPIIFEDILNLEVILVPTTRLDLRMSIRPLPLQYSKTSTSGTFFVTDLG